MSEQKARVLIVGTGGVGTMSAYALQQGGKAEVTAVMRSNYEAVKENGVNIDSDLPIVSYPAYRATCQCIKILTYR